MPSQEQIPLPVRPRCTEEPGGLAQSIPLLCLLPIPLLFPLLLLLLLLLFLLVITIWVVIVTTLSFVVIIIVILLLPLFPLMSSFISF